MSVGIQIILKLIWVGYVYGNFINVHTNGNDTEDCLIGQSPCSSLGYALTHSQSGDYINITSDTVSLPTVVEINDITNITIRGQGNTIVMCNNTGGVSFNNSSNVVIEGITWDQCGDPDLQHIAYPNAFGGLNFTNVTNVSINNCILQFSKVRALSLYFVAGFVNITNTQFLDNANYDVIHCFQGVVYIRCATDRRNVTGAVYIEDATSEASISISNCMFKNNGHFGEIFDDNTTFINFEESEIADGAAIKILQTNSIVPINIAVENSVFMQNRGRSGGAININVSQSQYIEFSNVRFWNNSVVRFYVNSSALFVFLRNTSSTELKLSHCNFQYNSEGRHTIGYIVAGEPSYVLISNCSFTDNTEYAVGLIELNMQSGSSVDFVNSTFANNTGNALLYVQVRSSSINVSLDGLHVINNTGTSVLRRGGLLTFRLFEDNCIVNISRLVYTMNRYFRNGGGLYITGVFRTNFRCYMQDALFESNIGRGQGAVVFSILQSDSIYVLTIYNSMFINNTGGSIVRIGKRALMEDIVITNKPSFLLLGQSTSFLNNTGTAIRLSDVVLVGNGNTEFSHNIAQSGAALYLTDSYVLPNVSSFQFNFFNNLAIVRGGAIFIDLSTLGVQCVWLLYQLEKDFTFCNENNFIIEDDCPGINGQLLCSELPQESSANNFQPCHFNYANNSASVAGSTIFYNVPESMPIENSSNPNSIFYIPKDHCMIMNHSSNSLRELATQPNRLTLYAPCLDNNCNTYFLSGIALGQEIRIPAYIVGYNNESAEATVFFVNCIENCSNIEIIGRIPVLINDQLSGISIIGKKSTSTMLIKLQLSSDTITVNLIVEITSCLPGYSYDSSTMQCECFTTNDIVSCSPNTTITRDHWFGVVDDITTVSVCPNGYCNFSRRGDEVASGRFLLSPIQDDQCNEHRTGPACGECDPGYTLSYDSVDCVSIDDCHYGYIIAVILVTLIYWILAIVFLFALMSLIIKRLQYSIGIGYLYGIIYYYSVVDVLLGQILNVSDGLNILVSILSIFFKLNPGFDLFKFCFAQGMERIDQYFINYTHSTAVLLCVLLLIMFTRTKYSERLTRLIGKVIIPTICLILTIAYVSIADTSLRLLQSIRFTGVDGTYIYLSPSIRYFTGRHIVYFLVALLYELVIVVGLPFLLILSHWTMQINLKFVRIDMKPIMDQFQGCYKNNFRWFSAVYLICRQVILIIVVIDFSDYYIELYLLTIVCLVTAILHYTVQPYKNDVLNKCDGVLLQLLLLVVSLQMVAFSNGFTIGGVEGLTYVLLLLPIIFIFVVFSVLILKPELVESEPADNAERRLRQQPTIDATPQPDTSTIPLPPANARAATIAVCRPAMNATTNSTMIELQNLRGAVPQNKPLYATTEFNTM